MIKDIFDYLISEIANSSPVATTNNWYKIEKDKYLIAINIFVVKFFWVEENEYIYSLGSLASEVNLSRISRTFWGISLLDGNAERLEDTPNKHFNKNSLSDELLAFRILLLKI